MGNGVAEQVDDLLDDLGVEDKEDNEKDTSSVDTEEAEDSEEAENDEEFEENEEEDEGEGDEGEGVSAELLLIQQMQKRIDNLEAQLTTKEEPAEEHAAPEPLDISSVLLTDTEADTLLDEPGKIVNSLVTRISEAIYTRVTADMANMKQEVVASAEQRSMSTYADQFFGKNTDLAPHKKYFGFRLREIAAAAAKDGKDASLPTLMQATAKELRKELNLTTKSGKTTNKKKSKPPVSGRPKNARRTSKKEVSKDDVGAQIDDMLAALGRK